MAISFHLKLIKFFVFVACQITGARVHLLKYYYKFQIEDNKIPCLCGSSNCRGTLNLFIKISLSTARGFKYFHCHIMRYMNSCLKTIKFHVWFVKLQGAL